MCSVSCRSRPDCPFRCNLICTPIILCFSGGSVSRVPSQHVDLLSASICHCLLLTFTSSLPLSSSHLCQISEESASHGHVSSISLYIASTPLSLLLIDLLPIRGLGSALPLPLWKYVDVELSFPAGVIDTDLG